MSKYYGDFRVLFEGFFSRYNYLSGELSYIERELEMNKKRREEFYNTQESREYLRIYNVIEKDKEKLSCLLADKGALDYCGTAIKEVIAQSQIESYLFSKVDYEEIDKTLGAIDMYESNYTEITSMKHRMSFIYIFTIFDSFLLELIKIILVNFRNMNDTQVREKMYSLSRASLRSKIVWFEHLEKDLNIDLDEVDYLIARRNAIVHNYSRISEDIFNKLPYSIISKYRISINDAISLYFDDLIKTSDMVRNAANNLIKIFKEVFCYDSNTASIIKEKNVNELESFKFSDWDDKKIDLLKNITTA